MDSVLTKAQLVKAATNAFEAIYFQDPDRLGKVIEAGVDEFMRLSRVGFHDQGFTDDDFRLMFFELTAFHKRQTAMLTTS